MVTLIATSLGIDVGELTPVLGHTLYDDRGLCGLGIFCDYSAASKVWCFGAKTLKYMKLPRPMHNPIPYGDKAQDFYVLPNKEFTHQFLHLRLVADRNWLNEEGEGLMMNKEEEGDDDDVDMGEASWNNNWEAPMPQNQGQPWRHQATFDDSNPQFHQFQQFQQFQQHYNQKNIQHKKNFTVNNNNVNNTLSFEGCNTKGMHLNFYPIAHQTIRCYRLKTNGGPIIRVGTPPWRIRWTSPTK